MEDMNDTNSKTQGEPMPHDKDGLIWHFTSAEALPKILLGADGLLAGHTSFMSDKEDCSLFNRNRAVLVGCFATYLAMTHRNILLDAETENITVGLHRNGIEYPTFIVCLTPVTDDQRRWKESTLNGGFALGFDAKMLEEFLKSDSNSFCDMCSYSDYDVCSKAILQKENRLRIIKENVKSKDYGTEFLLKDLVSLMVDCFNDEDTLVFKKRQDLDWEREFRVAFTFKEDVPVGRFRYIGNKPFVTMGLPVHISHCLKKIKVSPYGNAVQSKIMATLVAKSIGLKDEDVLESEC